MFEAKNQNNESNFNRNTSNYLFLNTNSSNRERDKTKDKISFNHNNEFLNKSKDIDQKINSHKLIDNSDSKENNNSSIKNIQEFAVSGNG